MARSGIIAICDAAAAMLRDHSSDSSDEFIRSATIKSELFPAYQQSELESPVVDLHPLRRDSRSAARGPWQYDPVIAIVAQMQCPVTDGTFDKIAIANFVALTTWVDETIQTVCRRPGVSIAGHQWIESQIDPFYDGETLKSDHILRSLCMTTFRRFATAS
ncbi:MAG: hypothetical protein AAF958_14205 [Planctomycetota bacterium]